MPPLNHGTWEDGMDHAGLAVGVAFARAVEVAGTASQDIRRSRSDRMEARN